jgi:hypothetical protein
MQASNAHFMWCNVVKMLDEVMRVQCSVVATRHQLLRRCHAGHAEHGARHVAQTDVVGQGEIIVAGFGRVFFERVKVVLIALEIVFLVIAQRLAVRAGLVCATMSTEAVSRRALIGGLNGATYWARLSEREKALLHRGQT